MTHSDLIIEARYDWQPARSESRLVFTLHSVLSISENPSFVCPAWLAQVLLSAADSQHFNTESKA